MDIKLTKAELVNGEIYYRIYHNGECIKSFIGDESKAKAERFYYDCIDRINDGYPKETTLESKS